MRRLELLAPAADADVAIEAVRHGADAVYIGPPSHGARKSAANSLDDIKRIVDYAHIFGVKVYVTVNTIVYESELKDVERMIRDLHDIGTDALIVQDMGILRMDIPPIPLHASTQCDIRTPEKARFLQEAGFSQLVLARELTIEEIRAVCSAVTIPVEVFVHGALCVSHSGRCGLGYACRGRSGNRGECPQICRQSFTLTDAEGHTLAKDRYLLSLKDFRADMHLEELVDAGVSSFKIEGRLKEAGYVKNVTSHYRRRLDEIILKSEGTLGRSSYGETAAIFTPALEKSFNRGFTDFYLTGKADQGGMASPLTPKALGEPISDVSLLTPGDGISYFDRGGNFCGVQVNAIRNGKITGNRPFDLPRGAQIYRTSSVEWKKLMARETASRSIGIHVTLNADTIQVETDSALRLSVPHNLTGTPAQKATRHRDPFEKLGGTPFRLDSFTDQTPDIFYPLSALTALRREMTDRLEEALRKAHPKEKRRLENRAYPYPSDHLTHSDNVANSKARNFYEDHGVKDIEPALEKGNPRDAAGKIVMTSRHCVLRELGMCMKEGHKCRQPLTLTTGPHRFRPEFDCVRCEMSLRIL